VGERSEPTDERRSRQRTPAGGAFGLAIFAAVAACAPMPGSAASSAQGIRAAAVAQPASPAPSARRYVALGDSYTAAPMVPPPDAGAPAACGRSAANYPHLVANHLRLTLTDVSCAAATVGDLTRAQYADVPAQLDALGPDTAVVTVGIGGNDNGLFARVVSDCGAAAAGVLAGSAAPCQERYGDQFANEIAADAEHIRAAIRQIHLHAPQARVLLVGYPAVLPNDTVGRVECLVAGVPFTPGDLAYIDGIEQALNAMLAAAAAEGGAAFVDTYTPSLGHDMCRLPGVRWVEPLLPLAQAAPMHPNALGEAATAAAVQGVMGHGG